MKSTFAADVIQYMRPNGRPKHIQFRLPVDSQPAYRAMLARGHRLEAEVLMTDQVSVTISDPGSEEDLDFSITPNGPEVQQGVVEMLERTTVT